VAELLDVLIVDAGLPGTGAAHHLQQRPDQRYAVLEARDAIGGPRDLFRYRGLRHYW
jgi:cyclohexanone monooxygenase